MRTMDYLYNDIVSHSIPKYLLKRLQHVHSAASFILGRYANKLDVLKLGWLPINERRENHLLYTLFLKLCTLITGRHT